MLGHTSFVHLLQDKERQRAKKAKTEQKHKLSFDDDYGEEDKPENGEEGIADRPQNSAQVCNSCAPPMSLLVVLTQAATLQSWG
jgi:hypothetical protein